MTDDNETRAETGRRLGYLFKHAQRLMEEHNAAALAPFAIEPRDLGVLMVIDSLDAPSQQQVAQRIGVDRTTMVALLDMLEAKGILVRHPDAADRRRNVVELTVTGREILERATAASDAAERAVLAPLSVAEGEQLRDLLTRVLAATPEARAATPETPETQG